jgi:hypothetical protein
MSRKWAIEKVTIETDRSLASLGMSDKTFSEEVRKRMKRILKKKRRSILLCIGETIATKERKRI